MESIGLQDEKLEVRHVVGIDEEGKADFGDAYTVSEYQEKCLSCLGIFGKGDLNGFKMDSGFLDFDNKEFFDEAKVKWNDLCEYPSGNKYGLEFIMCCRQVFCSLLRLSDDDFRKVGMGGLKETDKETDKELLDKEQDKEQKEECLKSDKSEDKTKVHPKGFYGFLVNLNLNKKENLKLCWRLPSDLANRIHDLFSEVKRKPDFDYSKSPYLINHGFKDDEMKIVGTELEYGDNAEVCRALMKYRDRKRNEEIGKTTSKSNIKNDNNIGECDKDEMQHGSCLGCYIS